MCSLTGSTKILSGAVDVRLNAIKLGMENRRLLHI